MIGSWWMERAGFHAGRHVDVWLRLPVQAGEVRIENFATGTLASVDAEGITLKTKGVEVQVPYLHISDVEHSANVALVGFGDPGETLALEHIGSVEELADWLAKYAGLSDDGVPGTWVGGERVRNISFRVQAGGWQSAGKPPVEDDGTVSVEAVRRAIEFNSAGPMSWSVCW